MFHTRSSIPFAMTEPEAALFPIDPHLCETANSRRHEMAERVLRDPFDTV
jgi:hypothetical protein